MIKSLVQDIATYVTSTFKLPNQLCDKLDCISSRLWWKHKLGEAKYLSLRACDLLR